MVTTLMLLNSIAAFVVVYYAVKLMRSRLAANQFPTSLLQESEREIARRSAECARNGHEWGITLTMIEIDENGNQTARESTKICTNCHVVADAHPPMPLRETEEE